MSLKPLSARERAAALEKATAARAIRAQAKQKIKSGQLGMAQVIAAADRDEALGRLKVSELLESLPGVGQVRTGAIMEQLNIAQSRRLRGLGIHQRKALISWFEGFRKG
ncbi:DNA-binding protein [Acaricomes phytoseiuli]|uniref:integration host factor, actinobacterial type n=1 Tax=Acaricomes phytoseiuli TaxID=291968 RepID=UPI000476D559|nr:integration host factor, actinobacterial type [Acaricomes phytoseiuli]MCW1249147.1 DNA-binding protein [Acaricomes phytoseiuli]